MNYCSLIMEKGPIYDIFLYVNRILSLSCSLPIYKLKRFFFHLYFCVCCFSFNERFLLLDVISYARLRKYYGSTKWFPLNDYVKLKRLNESFFLLQLIYIFWKQLAENANKINTQEYCVKDSVLHVYYFEISAILLWLRVKSIAHRNILQKIQHEMSISGAKFMVNFCKYNLIHICCICAASIMIIIYSSISILDQTFTAFSVVQQSIVLQIDATF